MVIAWIKWFITAIGVAVLFFIGAWLLEQITYQAPIDTVECKYTITMTAWYGQADYCANHFTIDGNTYLMYDSHDNLIGTVTAQDDYCIESVITK